MKYKALLTSLLLFLTTALAAQQGAELRRLIDLPTAGTLDRGSYAVDLRMFGNGGLLGRVAVGITPRFMFGISYGGENIIGEGDIDWNPRPGIVAKLRLIDENFAIPAITIGFDSQGYGPYNDEFDRYETKSRGLYAVASKNYAILLNLGLHAGLNFSLENDDDDEEVDFFLGADLSLNREIRAFVEYDVGTNDNLNDALFGSGQGYFNGGAQWNFSDRLFLQVNLKNIFQNGANDLTREFKLGYFEFF